MLSFYDGRSGSEKTDEEQEHINPTEQLAKQMAALFRSISIARLAELEFQLVDATRDDATIMGLGIKEMQVRE